MKLPFVKSKDDEVQPVEAELIEQHNENNAVQSGLKEQITSEIINRLGISLERRDSHEYHEEAVSPVITIGTDLDKEDELTHEIRTKEDKWGFWLEYHGTKGKIFDTEVPQFQFGHIAAISPTLRNHVYRYIYDIDEKTGCVKKDPEGKPIVLKKTRVHMATELSNMKARLNLAENGYARNQQKDVIVGGVGGVSTMSETSIDKAMQLAFGKGK